MCIVLSPGYIIKPEMLQPNDVLFFFQLYFLHSTVICYLKSNKTNPVLTNGSAFMEFKSILIRSLLMKSNFSYTHPQTQTVLSHIHFMSFPPFFCFVKIWTCTATILSETASHFFHSFSYSLFFYEQMQRAMQTTSKDHQSLDSAWD